MINIDLDINVYDEVLLIIPIIIKYVNNDGKIRTLKEREFHVKPSERRRVQKAQAVARWKKKVTASEKYFSPSNTSNRKKRK